MYSFSRTAGWYDGRPVAAGSTPSKLISARSSVSTNTSITRTGLLSSIKSSRHSGNSVHCPRSASSTKRLIHSPRAESWENHTSSTAFSHSQGHFRHSQPVRVDTVEKVENSTSAKFSLKSARGALRQGKLSLQS